MGLVGKIVLIIAGVALLLALAFYLWLVIVLPTDEIYGALQPWEVRKGKVGLST